MAYIPDEAIDRINELTGNAFKLFTYYCRRASKDEGICFAGIPKICDDLQWKRNHIYEYRKELLTEGWIAETDSGIKIVFGFPRPTKAKKTKSEKRTDSSPKNVPNPVRKPDSISPETVPGEVRKPDLIGTKTGLDKSEKRTGLVRKPDLHIRKNQPYNQCINQPYNQNTETPNGVSVDYGKLFSIFSTAFEGKYGLPYKPSKGNRKADFGQLENLVIQYGEKFKIEEWESLAVPNYFKTPQGSHTLKDLACRYAEFRRSALDRYGKSVIGGNGNGSKIVGGAAPVRGKYAGVLERDDSLHKVQ